MPKRCKDCDKVSLPNDEGYPAEKCHYCHSENLECDHPSSHFDVKKQCFICGVCGHENHDSLPELRKAAVDHPFLKEVIDTKIH